MASFEAETGKTIGVVYESSYHLMVVDLVTSDGIKYFPYERLLPAAEGCGVVALTVYHDRFVLLKQYRHAMRDWQYAFPRGFGETGITTEENLRKELREELGCDVLSAKFIGEIVANSGIAGNKVQVYLCEINGYEEHKHYEGIEKVILFSREELVRAIHEGKINDGFSLAALSLYNAR